MRVGLVIYGNLETVSGGYLYDRKLVDHLRRHGDTVEVVSLPWRGYARHLGDNFSASLLRRLERLPVDILLQDELNHPSLFWLNRRLKTLAPYPLVSIVHHLRSSEARPAWQNHFYRWVERRYLESLDGLVYNSQTTRQAAVHLGAAQAPGMVAYPAGDRLQPQITASEIARRARQPGPLRLFFLGNLIPRKGLHTLLAALRQMPRNEGAQWTLTVTGSLETDRSYAQALRERVAHHGLDQQVDFAGPLDDGELADRMRASHVLVVPSSYEGFGIVYLEGMGFGLPAIATTAGGAGEIITHGKDGFLVEPEDSAALAACLAELACNRQRLHYMSLAARQRYAAHPTWEESMARIRSFLQTML